MAERAPLHQSTFATGGMVPVNRSADMPLLPYEKQLITLLGCSEDEYLEFVQEVARKPYIRPQGYEHIPDARMEAATIISIVSLVIGLASTAISYLLTPKPKSAPESTSQDLSAIEGLTNYAPTFGFNSLQSLAKYGSVVPIVFTLREQHPENFSTGGLLISPPLIWSRLKSWGSFQVIEMITVAGQGPMAQPDQSGLYLGNNSLDAIYEAFYQFYWNAGSASSSRLLGQDLYYGTLATPAVPSALEDAFVCPTFAGVNDTGFCGTFSPVNQTQFGVYGAMPNGTPYRPNWEVVSVLTDQTNSGKNQAITLQYKFFDEYVAANDPYGGVGRTPSLWGQPGTGRNFARHIGIIEHNGYQLTTPSEGAATISGVEGTYRIWNGALTETRYVAVNDTIKIRFGYGRQATDALPAFGDATALDLTDIRSALDAEAEQQDQAFTLNSLFMIGRSTWLVTERKFISESGKVTDDAFNPGQGYVEITLTCQETWSSAQNKIGLVSPIAIYEQGWMPGYADIDETWYPICKVQLGQIVNNRACDVTEIGLKSQCWVQFNSITNFNTVPSPDQLVYDYNDKNVSLREGKNTSYGKRTSFFALDIRPAGDDAIKELANDGFVNLGPYLFAVTGTTPQDIFSFIRITHPETKAYEYRLRPIVSSVFTQQSGGGNDVFQINGATTPYQEWDSSTTYGSFKVGGRGKFVKPKDLFVHSEMVGKPEMSRGEYRSTGTPTSVTLVDVRKASDGSVAEYNTISNILSLAVGLDPYFNNLPNGSEIVLTNFIYDNDDGKTINLSLSLESYQQTRETTPRDRWWRIVSQTVESSTGTWALQEPFAISALSKDGTKYYFNFTIQTTETEYFEYETPIEITRTWEPYSAVAEVSHYGTLLRRSCDNNMEHEVIYINESIAEKNLVEYKNCAITGLKLQSSANINSLDQLQVYQQEGLQVDRLTDGDFGASNLFTDLMWYLCTNKDTGAGSLISSDLVDRAQLAETGRFLRANKLFFDDVITDPINLRSWIAEKCPSLLCYITIKNGKLAINPALPYNSDYTISNSKPAQIAALFTDGNIIENSFQLEWLSLEERKMFQATIVYRRSDVNLLPESITTVVRYNDADANDLPVEEFELPHITSDLHAQLAAKYFLAVRKHITHTISFSTLPYGLSLAPGDFIMVAVELSPYRPSNNGIIRTDGTLVTVLPLADGNHPVYYWDRSQSTIHEGTLNVVGGIAQNLRNTIISIKSVVSQSDVYMIEAIDVDQEGIVSIKASNFPVDEKGVSLISKDLLASNVFEVI